MNENALRRLRLEGQKAVQGRLLPSGAAEDRGQQARIGVGRKRCGIEPRIAGADHDLDQVDAGRRQHDLDRPAHGRADAQRAILLGHRPGRPRTVACGQNQGGGFHGCSRQRPAFHP
jgi:hypothetical protein